MDKYTWLRSLIFSTHLLIFVFKFSQAREVPLSLSSSTLPSYFSPEYFAVRFNPYVASGDSANVYDESDLLKMIGLIVTQFSNVLAPRIGVKDVKSRSSLSLVATSIAKFNLMHETTREGHMKVFMAFRDDHISKGDITSFDVVLQVAEKANYIYPGTVEYLLVKPKWLNESNEDQVLDELNHGKEKIGGKPYKLGGMFPLSACGVENGTSPIYLDNLREHLKLIVFGVSPDRKDYIDGVEDTVSRYTQQFQSCKKLLKDGDNGKSDIEVAFLTSWADCDCEGNKNTSNFIYFWKKMNDWAIDTKTKIFMQEAFDVPIRGGINRFKGWWKLRSKGPLGDDVYQDKLGELIQFLPRPNGKKGNATSLLSTILIAVFTSLSLLVVMGITLFVLYKRVSNKIKNGHYQLTTEEVQEFFEGAGAKTGQACGVGDGDSFQLEARRGSVDELICSVNGIAYNKDYELDKKEFVIEEDSILGSGNFGIVCRGTVLKVSGEVEVAVKMLKSGGPKTGLKSLLSETKLQSRLGQHDNVVSLVGAYTAELKKGNVLVFTELCEMGSLEKYLKKSYAPRYSMPPENTSSRNDDAELESSFAESAVAIVGNYGGKPQRPVAEALLRWSYEIACGMEFLASKRVVHADLASRNVLLTKNLTAKISDFGLSRRLYDYTSYIKSAIEPLPWAYLSPESLKRMLFNEKTDVWAYGITLWEIYSLGEKPYPGLTWSWDFSAKLTNGLRPGEPEYNSNNMYITMLKCWNINPVLRPSFKELVQHLRWINDQSQAESFMASSESKEIEVKLVDESMPDSSVYLF